MRHPLAAALLLLVPAIAAAQVVPQPAPPSITTTGESSVYVAPDEIVLTVGIETFSAQLDRAKSDLDARSQSLLKSIKDTGVDAKDVQTDAVQVELRYKSGDETLELKGYVARRSYVIKIKEVAKLESIVDVALKNGANHLFGIDHQTTELRKHRDAARKMAIRAAREKAVLLAGELSMTVGTPRQISEGSFWSGYSGGSWGGGRYGGAMTQNSFQHANAGPAVEGTMPLGQIAIRAQVSVTFDLYPAEQ